jgi:pimeloyl-ACP methyl ester carboxylesterase
MTDKAQKCHNGSNMWDKIWHQWLRQPYNLNVIDYGGTGPVVILLHGIASSSAHWDHLIPLLWQNYHCICIDLLGFGDSPKPQWAGYSMDEHVRMVRATIRKLRIKKPYALLGHSLGSLISVRYARHYSKEVSRLVLLSPPAYGPLDAIRNLAARRRTSFYMAAYRFIRSNQAFTTQNIRRFTRFLPQLSELTIDEKTWVPFVKSLEQCIETQTLVEDLRHTSTPTDIFYGLLDEVVVPYNVKRLADIRDVSLHALPVGHSVNKRYAQGVAAVLSETDSINS